MAQRPVLSCSLAFLLLGMVTTGCHHAKQIRDPDYARASRAVQVAWCSAPMAVVATAPVVDDLAGPHTVEEYIDVALRQNPEIEAARKKMEALAHQVPVAASLPDPTLNVTTQPEPVQTAAGQQELIVAAKQKLYWFGKLDTRAGMAEARTKGARARLAAVELATIAKV